MVARRESPDSETWLVLLNVVDTASALDKAVALMERSRAEGRGSEASPTLVANKNKIRKRWGSQIEVVPQS